MWFGWWKMEGNDDNSRAGITLQLQLGIILNSYLLISLRYEHKWWAQQMFNFEAISFNDDVLGDVVWRWFPQQSFCFAMKIVDIIYAYLRLSQVCDFKKQTFKIDRKAEDSNYTQRCGDLKWITIQKVLSFYLESHPWKCYRLENFLSGLSKRG